MGLALAMLLTAVAAAPVPGAVAPPVVRTSGDDDEQMLKSAGFDGSSSGLIALFRERAVPPDQTKLQQLATLFASADASERDRATAGLLRAGSASIPVLRPVANSLENPEAAIRARRCLETLEGSSNGNLVRAAIRLALVRKLPDLSAALLAYLPSAETDAIAEEIETALSGIAVQDGKPDPAILSALNDAAPIRRAAAVAALCRAGGEVALRSVRPALADPHASVRLKAALGLVDLNDADAVPVLIDLLTTPIARQHKAAEQGLVALAGEWALTTPQGDDVLSGKLRRDAWLAWWNDVSGDTLLESLRGRTLSDAERAKVKTLLAQLQADAEDRRGAAAAELIGMGGRALPLLERAANGPTASQLSRIVSEIEIDNPVRPLPDCAARLLALRRPPGALEAILAYLPTLASDDARSRLQDVLPSLGIRDGKADPALVRALTDAAPERRIAAALALCRGGARAEFDKVAPLLTDADFDVRLQAALALAGARDRSAVATLIALLADHPNFDAACDVEDYLRRLAGDAAPSVELSPAPAERVKARGEWLTWWKANEASLDLSKLEAQQKSHGELVIAELMVPAMRNGGRIAAFSPANKINWQITGLLGPHFFELLPGDRLLIAEQNGNRVTERDLTGRVLWERSVALPFYCQRLPNGNTFIAGRNLILEIDRTGKEVYSQARPDYLVSVRRLRNGQIALVNNQGVYHRIDSTGKVLLNYSIPVSPNFGVPIMEVLPGDRVLLTVPQLGKMMEYDDGKTTWQTSLFTSGQPTRQANGHILVARNQAGSIVELDRQGKVVRERKNVPALAWRVVLR